MSQSPPSPPQLRTPRGHHRGSGEWVLDVITAIFLMASVVVVGGMVLIISNPDAPFNPFPLAALPTLFQTPTPTITFTPSSTPTASATPLPPTPTASNTPTTTPTATVTPSITPTPVIPGIEVAPTLAVTLDLNPDNSATPGLGNGTLDPLTPFAFIARTVRYEANTNDQGCQWLSIAGNITGLAGEPVLDLAVEVSGDDFQYVQFSGNAPAFGPSGFEVPVGSSPARDEFAVRLIGPIGIPVSDYVSVTTNNTCDANVAVVEFVQVKDY